LRENRVEREDHRQSKAGIDRHRIFRQVLNAQTVKERNIVCRGHRAVRSRDDDAGIGYCRGLRTRFLNGLTDRGVAGFRLRGPVPMPDRHGANEWKAAWSVGHHKPIWFVFTRRQARRR
jgi:hypothetical protein